MTAGQRSPSKSACVCIPVHGPSDALDQLLERLLGDSDPRMARARIFVSNSGPAPAIRKPNPRIVEINISNEKYWSGAVAELYTRAQTAGVDWVLLLNHDCLPTASCLTLMFDFAEQHPNCVVHALLVYKRDSQRVFWAGAILRPGRSFQNPYKERRLPVLPTAPYKIDAAMGQCLLMPVQAARTDYLHSSRLPHYFSDSVQTSEMRRAGFGLYLHPQAVAMSDQSDIEGKRARIRASSWSGVWNAWTAPYSSRNLKAGAVAAWLHQDSLAGRVSHATTFTAGRILKPILERLGVLEQL